ncbi:hypothetical protein DPMN_133261 [Dreissena polymorpha]|uniref:Uncharacterized protein n=1 Tax=Dreissena polymorpha TaxID=45954 RepID=A0A9D4FT78_DREPO|nr:hypothetical protein DPMN_133261 [Dreissena polymorpha]
MIIGYGRRVCSTEFKCTVNWILLERLRKKLIGSSEFEDILGLIRVNFNQVRCTIRDNDGVICIQQDHKRKPRYCSIWVDKFNPNGSIYMQVLQ